jgi:hypothetical protein
MMRRCGRQVRTPIAAWAGLTWRQGKRSLDQVDVVPPGEQHI